VARHLSQAGLIVVDADDLVADLYRNDQPGAAVVRELFGDEFIAEDGSVDSPSLAKKVFSETAALERLEEKIHPLVRAMFSKIAAAVSSPIVLEGTLLVEAGYAPAFDLLVTVEADQATRLERAVERGLSVEEAKARMAAQGDGELRRRAADRIIRNDGSLQELLDETDEIVEWIREAQTRS
jgi:dephospho-CoA kinase